MAVSSKTTQRTVFYFAVTDRKTQSDRHLK